MTPRPLRRATTSTVILLAASVATLAALVAIHPKLPARPTVWSGDDLALAGTWLVGCACATWLTITTLACLAAMTRGRHARARRIAGWAPPIARRILQSALLGTWALVPAAAYAAPGSPLTLHAGPGGKLAPVSGTAPSSDTPVVRTPPTTTTTMAAPAPARRVTPAPPAAVPSSTPARPPGQSASARPTRARADAPTGRVYTVRAGDNLWRIARSELIRARGLTHADDQIIAPYWQRVIAANRATLRSGNPSLIFPGELVVLPTD